MFDIFVLFCMIFCHIIDDYYLQGWLASAKQKSYWGKNAPDELYKNDYKMALAMHGFSWTFMIMLVPTLLKLKNIWLYPALFVVNWVIHCVVDDMKANEKMINLIQDQLIHMVQIVMTWLCYYVLI